MKPLARLPVAKAAFVKPIEFVGNYNKKLRQYCPQAVKEHRQYSRLPPKCTDPDFVWNATMRPILTEVLIKPNADRFKRPRLLSAASRAALKMAADEERQNRDFLSSGGCKGLHTPHVCQYNVKRIMLPRFFTLLNTARRNWATPGLLNVAVPHLGRLTRPEQRFLKRGFPLITTELAVFEGARECGLEDQRILRLCDRAYAVFDPPPPAPATAEARAEPEQAARLPAVSEAAALVERMGTFLWSKSLFPWALEESYGRHVQWERDPVIRRTTCAITAPVRCYLSDKLDGEREAAVRAAATDLLLMQNFLLIVADESCCLHIAPGTSSTTTIEEVPAAEGEAAPSNTDVEMQGGSGDDGDDCTDPYLATDAQASQPVTCSREETLEFAHGAIALLMAGPLGILLEAVVVGVVLDSRPPGANMALRASDISETRAVLWPYEEDEDMDDEDALAHEPVDMDIARARVQLGIAAFHAYMREALRNGSLDEAAEQATLCDRLQLVRTLAMHLPLVPALHEHLWRLLDSDSTLTSEARRSGVPIVSYSPPLFRGWQGIGMEEWRAIVVLRRPELLELEGLLPVVAKDWDPEVMPNERGGAGGLQHLPRLSLPRARAFWGLGGYDKVTLKEGSVRERYIPLWWKPPAEEYEYAERLPAGPEIKDVDMLFEVGAIDLNMRLALRCTQQRRVTYGTYGRTRPPAWVRKDLTGINGRATIKRKKSNNPIHKILKRSFASSMEHAARTMFSRGGRLELNREFWRFRTPERAAIYRVWVDHLRATGRNPPVPQQRKGFPHGVVRHLASAFKRQAADKGIPRDVFNWMFDSFDSTTDGFELPPAPELPLPERENLPFVLAEHCLLEAAGRSAEIEPSRLEDVRRPQDREDVVGGLDWLRELLSPHSALLTCTAYAAASGTVAVAPVLETNLQPYTYPVQPLSLFDTARETEALPWQAEWHTSVHMRLSWPPGAGVALPLGWRALSLLQVASMRRGYVTRRTLDALVKEVAAGQVRPEFAELLPPWDGLGRTAKDNGLAAGVVRLSGMRPKQSMFNGTRFPAREVLEAKGWLFKGSRIERYPSQPEGFFLPKASRKGCAANARAATARAKAQARAKAARAKARAKRPHVPHLRPRPPKSCYCRPAAELFGLNESTPAADAIAAQRAAAASAAATVQAQQPRIGSGPVDPILALQSWRNSCAAARDAAEDRREATLAEIAAERAQSLLGVAEAPLRMEEALAVLPFTSADRITAAVEHRLAFPDVLAAALDPTKRRQRPDAVLFEPICNPDVTINADVGEESDAWLQQFRAERQALVSGADDTGHAYGAAAMPGDLVEALQAALATVPDSTRLVTLAPLPAAMTNRPALKPALKPANRPPPTGVQERLEAARRADRHVTIRLPEGAQARPRPHGSAPKARLRVARRRGKRGAAEPDVPHVPELRSSAGTTGASAASADAAHMKRRKGLGGSVVASGAADAAAGPSATGEDVRGTSPPAACMQVAGDSETWQDAGGASGTWWGSAMLADDVQEMRASPGPAPPACPDPDSSMLDAQGVCQLSGGQQADRVGILPAAVAGGSSGLAQSAAAAEQTVDMSLAAEGTASAAGAGTSAAGGSGAAAEAVLAQDASEDEEEDEMAYMTNLERARAIQQKKNAAALASLKSGIDSLFPDDETAKKKVEKRKQRKALDSIPGKGVNAPEPVERSRRNVPKPDYSLAKAEAAYRASAAEARRLHAAGRKARRPAAGAGSSAAAARPSTAAEIAAATWSVGDDVKHKMKYNTTPATSMQAWVAAGEAADKQLESLGEDAIACVVNLTTSMIDSGFWLQLPRELVRAVLEALDCDSFQPASDADHSDLVHVFETPGAGKTAMTITVQEGLLEKRFWSAKRPTGSRMPADGEAESVLQFLPKGSTKAAGVRGAGLSGGWRGVSIAHKLQRGDCAVFQMHLGSEVDSSLRGSAAHIESARAALQSGTMSAWFFRARTHDDSLADPYAEPLKLEEEDGMDGVEEGSEVALDDEEEEDGDGMDLD
eukprot:jgi/Ulvmu1/9204/UM005_0304.1